MVSNLESWRLAAGLDYVALAAHIGHGCTPVEAEAYALGTVLPTGLHFDGINTLLREPPRYDLKTWRKAKRWSQSELCRAIGDGCTPQRISMYERGREMLTGPRYERIRAISGGLVGLYEVHQVYLECQRQLGHPRFRDLPVAKGHAA